MSNEPRQRWRIVVARDEQASDLVHREIAATWDAGLLAGGLPVQVSEGGTPRPRVSFAAPAPIGMLAERELIDIVLTELVPVHRVREAVQAAAPAGYRVVDVFDVWLGSPTLPSLVVAGEYRANLRASDDGAGPVSRAEVDDAIAGLLAMPRIERQRAKGQGTATVDIRPHVLALRAVGESEASAGDAVRVWMRLRLGGEGGVGRPEEVVAVLGETVGRQLVAEGLTRERIVLAGDPEA